MSLEFRLLGRVEVRRDGVPLPLGTAKQRAMLTTLLLEANRPVSLDRLIEPLWGATPPRSAVANLRSYAAALRRILCEPARSGTARLVAERRAYVLTVDPGELDLATFEDLAAQARAALARDDAAFAVQRLSEALAIWRGAAGEGLPTGTVLEFQLTALDERRLAVLEDWAETRLALGEHAVLVGELRAHVAEHPLRERAWGQLMLALYRSGNAASALAAYADAAAVLQKQLGIKPGMELRRLHAAMLDRDEALTAPPADRSSTRIAAPRPDQEQGHAATSRRQLPPGVTVVGRASQLATLCAAVAPGGASDAPTIVAVHGPAGVGKSSLAIHAAHTLAASFPDGQLYVDLQGNRADVEPLTHGEALARLLRTLGVPPPEVPPHDAERAGWYRSLLAGRRVLILFDNATDAAQLRPLLLAHPEGAVLLTSRRKLTTLDGASHLGLGPLTPASALDLLRDLAGRGRVDADASVAAQLARLCDHLPLALRIAGARLASRPRWPLHLLVDYMAEERHRLDLLSFEDLCMRSSLAGSYRPLTRHDPAAARAFRLLGLFRPAEVSLAAGAALLGVPISTAKRTLERLVDTRLLDSPAPGRYRMPDLVRLYAKELASEHETQPERLAAVRRVLMTEPAELDFDPRLPASPGPIAFTASQH
ncbi:MAG TPA: BTAD domain-containing putative transcriptional regulator [Kribbellaceae bacterium]|jgi:DNA-binding SARP family transcriptional activator